MREKITGLDTNSTNFHQRRSPISSVPIRRIRVYNDEMADTLQINEIYLSLQGESTFAGLPCVFVRLTACNLRCSYCDTAYAFKEGRKMSLADARAEVQRLAASFRSHLGAASGLPL